eukprot:PhF_6_TR31188/c0_g1_i1/m.45735/K14137/PTAR1; protein prenyltransferase alpha subunit repeat containing protein 1
MDSLVLYDFASNEVHQSSFTHDGITSIHQVPPPPAELQSTQGLEVWHSAMEQVVRVVASQQGAEKINYYWEMFSQSVLSHPYVQYGALKRMLFLSQCESSSSQSCISLHYIGFMPVPSMTMEIARNDGSGEVEGLAFSKSSVPYIFRLSQQERDDDVFLIVSPENYTVWNRRKTTLLQRVNVAGHESISNFVNQERWINRLALSVRPKSGESWAHRGWLLRTFPQEMTSALCFEEEFDLITECCQVYPRNYYAWNYRHKLIDVVGSSSSYPELLFSQLEFSLQWLSRNLHDHSVVAYAMKIWVTMAPRYAKIRSRTLMLETHRKHFHRLH